MIQIYDTSEPEGNPSPLATAAHTIWNIWPSQKFNRSGQFYTEPVLTGNQLINLGNSEWSSFFHSKQVLSYYGRYVSSGSFTNIATPRGTFRAGRTNSAPIDGAGGGMNYNSE